MQPRRPAGTLASPPERDVGQGYARTTKPLFPGRVVSIREKSRQLAIVLEAVQLAERDVPDYIEADHNKMTATFVRTPGLSDVPYAVVMEPNLVIEYYAQN